jgi:hypothetical protein
MVFLRYVLLAGLGALASGCATTRAAAPVERPPLDVPAPPPRVIVPLPPPETPVLEPIGELPQPAGGAAPSRPRPQRDKPPAEPAKPETKPPETPVVEQPAQPPPTPPVNARPPDNAQTAQLTNQIQDTIGRSRAILQKIDPAGLKGPLQKAHVDARLFADQADAALKDGNLVLAKELAEKSERLAKEVQGRAPGS